MHSMKSCEFSFVWGKMRIQPGKQHFRIAEELLHRGRGGSQDTGEFGEVRIQAITHFFAGFCGL